MVQSVGRRQSWLDRSAYPFPSHWLLTEAGRLHYVDEGDGAPILMLHGNPTWSFLYRHLIRQLATEYRCVAPDYLGFGLSQKPTMWSYRPEAHARHVQHLIEALDLRDITMVVHDWGGPIGLSYALVRPERVKRLVIMNSWMWSLRDNWQVLLFSRMLGSSVGRFMIQQFNLMARAIPLGFGDRSRLTERAYHHYVAPFDTYDRRKGTWVFSKALLDATPWLDGLWNRRHRLVGKPVLLVWGMRDLFFRRQALERWRSLFPDATVQLLDDVGHFVPEEVGPGLSVLIEPFLRETD